MNRDPWRPKHLGLADYLGTTVGCWPAGENLAIRSAYDMWVTAGTKTKVCYVCRGSGTEGKSKCSACRGKGVLPAA